MDAFLSCVKRIECRIAPIQLKPEAVAIMTQLALAHLRRLRDVLGQVSPWDRNQIEAEVRGYAKPSLKLRDIAQPLRVAVTFSTVSPPLFEAMEILGYRETMARIDMWISCSQTRQG